MRLTALSDRTKPEWDGIEIGGMTADSRAVMPGWLFAALPGSRADGRAFIADALARGAVALLVPKDTPVSWPEGTPVITDSRPRRRYALMAARFYRRQPETAVAVTGTNGKTSVVRFVRQLWAALGRNGASVGTLGVDSDVLTRPGGLTTPDPAALHEMLTTLTDKGISHVAFEASSHGLDQNRLDGVRLTAAGFTHIAADHLDYHGSEEAYFLAKARLFGELLAPGGTAVVNIDTPGGQAMEDLAWARGLTIIPVGRTQTARLRLHTATPIATGQTLALTWDGQPFTVELPLMGGFQAENALVAAGLAIAAGDPPERVLPALAHLTGVPGRMDLVGRTAEGAPVFVDYAHTAGGLETVLRAARPHIQGRLCVVFGCGGDRDSTKRPVMGRVAARHADTVFITDDNPRTEDPTVIRAAIREGCPDARVIADRAQAIARAIAQLRPGDGLIIAGKGHETGQIVGDSILPFDDRDEAARHLAPRQQETAP